jgi:alpha-galactosidase
MILPPKALLLVTLALSFVFDSFDAGFGQNTENLHNPGPVVWKESGPRLRILPDDPQPAMHGPSIVGATPNRPFLFRVAATGTKPLAFSATNLPPGLQLDAGTGIISGALLQSDTTLVTLSVSGPAGVAQRVLTIVGGENKLVLTPPMGWNSWNVWGTKVDQEKVSDAGHQLLSTRLADHGYQYVNIDDSWEEGPLPTIVGRWLRWYLPTFRDSQGNISANGKFPDMKALCDELHQEGLKAGIYSSPGPQTCAGYIGSYQHEDQDAQTFAHWGFDYLKYDWCTYGRVTKGDDSLEALQKPYRIMASALAKTDRDIVYSLCQYGMGEVWKWGADPDIRGNCWRTHSDIVDLWSGFHCGIYDIIEAQAGLEKYAGPGHWNDPDMLMVGVVGLGGIHPTRLTPNEQIVHISMWCLLAAPLFIGCDMSKLDPFTLAILSNDEVLAIDQDPLGKPAARVSKDELGREVWSRELSDGTRAVGLLNPLPSEQNIEVHWSDIGLSGPQPVRDLWLHEDLGSFTDNYSIAVPSHGIVVLKIGRPTK